MAEMEVTTMRFSAADMAALQQEAAAKSVAVSEVIRQAVAEHLARQTLARAVPLLDQTLGKHIDRLAALIAKTYVAADMAHCQSSAVCNALIRDLKPEAIMAEARQRALIDLRRSGTDIGMDEDVYAPQA